MNPALPDPLGAFMRMLFELSLKDKLHPDLSADERELLICEVRGLAQAVLLGQPPDLPPAHLDYLLSKNSGVHEIRRKRGVS